MKLYREALLLFLHSTFVFIPEVLRSPGANFHRDEEELGLSIERKEIRESILSVWLIVYIFSRLYFPLCWPQGNKRLPGNLKEKKNLSRKSIADLEVCGSDGFAKVNKQIKKKPFPTLVVFLVSPRVDSRGILTFRWRHELLHHLIIVLLPAVFLIPAGESDASVYTTYRTSNLRLSICKVISTRWKLFQLASGEVVGTKSFHATSSLARQSRRLMIDPFRLFKKKKRRLEEKLEEEDAFWVQTRFIVSSLQALTGAARRWWNPNMGHWVVFHADNVPSAADREKPTANSHHNVSVDIVLSPWRIGPSASHFRTELRAEAIVFHRIVREYWGRSTSNSLESALSPKLGKNEMNWTAHVTVLMGNFLVSHVDEA